MAFRTGQIPAIVENAAVQAGHGKDQHGRKTETAFQATGFGLGRGPDGEAVLTMAVGRAGAISFLLPEDMPAQLSAKLQGLAN